MNRRIASLAVALALGACHPVAPLSAAPAPPEIVEILVNGTPQRRYAHAGRWYVEAVKNREYAIRLRNPYGVRVAVALSVDGLNTIDARETTAADARKWVLGPYETVTIEGWQTSTTEARRFEFTTEGRSYGQALGKTANLGVIAAVFFRERVARVLPGPMRPDSSRNEGQGGRAAPSAAPAERAAESENRAKALDDYAATGMGQRTEHAVTQVWLDLEPEPSQRVDIRYEYRPQLVRLGVLTPDPPADPLRRRERARGFEPGFCPEPPRH